MTENHSTTTVDSKKRRHDAAVAHSSSSAAPIRAAGHSQKHPLASGSHRSEKAPSSITTYPRTHHHPNYGGYGNTFGPYSTSWHYPVPPPAHYLPPPSFPAKVAEKRTSVPKIVKSTSTSAPSEIKSEFSAARESGVPTSTESKLGEKDIHCSSNNTVDYNAHRGNQRFLQMIGANRGMYYWKLPKQKKTLLIRKIVDFVASAGSRFLAQKKSGSNQEWYDIGFCQSCKVVAALLKRDGDGVKNQDKQVEEDEEEEEFDFSELEEQKSKFDELGSSKFVVPPHIQKWYYPPQKESPPQSQRDNSRPVYQHSKGNSGWYSYGSSYYPYPHYPPAAYSHPYAWNSYPPTFSHPAHSWTQAHDDHQRATNGLAASDRPNPLKQGPSATLISQIPTKRQRVESPPVNECGDKTSTTSGGERDSNFPSGLSIKKGQPVVSQAQSIPGVSRRVSDDTITLVVSSDPSPESKCAKQSDTQNAPIVRVEDWTAPNNDAKEGILQGLEEHPGSVSGLAALSAAALLRLCDHAPSVVASDKEAPSVANEHQHRHEARTIIL